MAKPPVTTNLCATLTRITSFRAGEEAGGAALVWSWPRWRLVVAVVWCRVSYTRRAWRHQCLH
eukprot:5998688-Prorocentrum_lima.AAC.1